VGARIVGRLFLSQRRTAVSATTLTVAETSTSAGPPALGAFGEMSTEWTGRLSLNGACAPVRAAVTEAAHNPKLSAWPEDLQLDLVNDPVISILDIQAWVLETQAPVVILRCIDGTDQQFDQLVGALKNSSSYATVRWESQGVTLERLVLKPVGGLLLCAAFPDDGIPKRPTHHQPRPIRIMAKKKKSPPGPEPDPMATSTSI